MVPACAKSMSRVALTKSKGRLASTWRAQILTSNHLVRFRNFTVAKNVRAWTFRSFWVDIITSCRRQCRSENCDIFKQIYHSSTGSACVGWRITKEGFPAYDLCAGLLIIANIRELLFCTFQILSKRRFQPAKFHWWLVGSRLSILDLRTNHCIGSSVCPFA
jgi:hypothetical protein